MERGGGSGWKASQVWVELWSTHCLAITPNKVHSPNINRVSWHPFEPLRHVVLSRLIWQPSETHVRGGCSRCCRPRRLRLPSHPQHLRPLSRPVPSHPRHRGGAAPKTCLGLGGYPAIAVRGTHEGGRRNGKSADVLYYYQMLLIGTTHEILTRRCPRHSQEAATPLLRVRPEQTRFVVG